MGLHGEKCENQAMPSMRKISKVQKNLRMVGHLGLNDPKLRSGRRKAAFIVELRNSHFKR